MVRKTQWPSGTTYEEWKKYWDVEDGDWKEDNIDLQDVAEQDIVSAVNEIERLKDLLGAEQEISRIRGEEIERLLGELEAVQRHTCRPSKSGMAAKKEEIDGVQDHKQRQGAHYPGSRDTKTE